MLSEELERLARRATKAPIEFATDDKWIFIGRKGYADYRSAFAQVDYDDVDHTKALSDAALIVALRNNLPTIIAALKAKEQS